MGSGGGEVGAAMAGAVACTPAGAPAQPAAGVLHSLCVPDPTWSSDASWSASMQRQRPFWELDALATTALRA